MSGDSDERPETADPGNDAPVSAAAVYAAKLLEGVDLNDLDALAAALGEDLSAWE